MGPSESPLSPDHIEHANHHRVLESKLKTSKWLLGLMAVAVAGVGAVVVFLTHAGGTGDQYYSFQLQESYTSYNNGKTSQKAYTNPTVCKANYYICHDPNGSLVLENSYDPYQTNYAWKSGPATAGPVKAWFGPYFWEGSSDYAYNWGYTGSNSACFYMQDVSGGQTHANVTFAITGRSVATNQLRVLGSTRGNLSGTYKNYYNFLCLPYYHADEVKDIQYRLTVNSGRVQTDFVEVQIGYYNPYPYYGGAAIKNHNGVEATACSSKSRTGSCANSADTTKYNVKRQLTNVDTKPAVDLE